MTIADFAQFMSKRKGKPYTEQEAQEYLDLVDMTIDEAVEELGWFDDYVATAKEADLPETDTPEGQLHHDKLTDPFS